MKQICCLLLAAGLFACSHHNDDSPVIIDCLQRISKPVNAHSIANDEVAKANELFASNNIPYQNLQYLRFRIDTSLSQFIPSDGSTYISISSREYTNGLPILNSDVYYRFKADTLLNTSGLRTSGTSLDTIAHLTKEQVRLLFLHDVQHDRGAYTGYPDSCAVAEFGYYNTDTSYWHPSEKLVKAWLVYIRRYGKYSFPIGYYRDTDGKQLYYYNGVSFYATRQQ